MYNDRMPVPVTSLITLRASKWSLLVLPSTIALNQALEVLVPPEPFLQLDMLLHSHGYVLCQDSPTLNARSSSPSEAEAIAGRKLISHPISEL